MPTFSRNTSAAAMASAMDWPSTRRGGSMMFSRMVVGGHQGAVATGLELELLAGDQYLALMGVFQQVDAAQQGAFPGAGGAEDGNDVAIPGQQVDALENLKIAIALVQVAHFESRGCH